MHLLALLLLGFYVAVVTLAAILGYIAQYISGRNLTWTLLWTLFVIVFTYIFVSRHNLYALAGVAAGLFGYSSVALRNAQYLRQSPRLHHHLIRLAIHLFLLALLYFTR